jgi:hypothetical protein
MFLILVTGSKKVKSTRTLLSHVQGVRECLPLVILLALVLGSTSGIYAVDYSACGDDASGDVCQGRWDVLGLDPVCRGRMERPNIDIIYAETSDDVSHVRFVTRVSGRVSKSLKVMYGYRGTIGEGFLGTKKHVTIWVIDGTAYIMTDLTRQLFPVKEPMATSIDNETITVRIPMTDIGECTRWEVKAFAVEAERNLGPGMLIASGYYDEIDLKPCSVGEGYLPMLILIFFIGFNRGRIRQKKG